LINISLCIMRISSNSLSLAGEYLVLSQLALRGYVATLTLGNTKSVDILLSNENTGKLFKVEVKTTSTGSTRLKAFGTNIEWKMGEKHENIIDPNLFYCFVQIEDLNFEKIRFFIIPSSDVAKFVKEDEEYYHSYPHKKPVKHTPMRIFRIRLSDESRGLDPRVYENKWDYFDN
jgi:hypothetical protein